MYNRFVDEVFDELAEGHDAGYEEDLFDLDELDKLFNHYDEPFADLYGETQAGFSFSDFPSSVLNALRRGLENAAIRLAITFGFRDQAKLTNLIFFSRHQDLCCEPLQKGQPYFKELSQEWKVIRDQLVLPILSTHPPSDPATPSEGKIGPVPEVNTLMPDNGPGFRASKPPENRWGLPETILALTTIGALWFQVRPRGPRITIRDISRRGGGRLGKHLAHRVGLDVDIWAMRNDGRREPVDFKKQPTAYSQLLTQKLVNVIKGNGVKCIFFDDPGIEGVRKVKSRHTNHLHVRFCMPAYYDSSLMIARAHPRDSTPPKYDCPPYWC